jgi:hypothetical protein
MAGEDEDEAEEGAPIVAAAAHRFQQQQVGMKSGGAPAEAAAWRVPAARGVSAPALSMARSLPRPISGTRLARLVAGEEGATGGGGGGDHGGSSDEEGFVPPHLATSMVEPQVRGCAAVGPPFAGGCGQPTAGRYRSCGRPAALAPMAQG